MREPPYLRSNAKLVRRAAIRRVLTGRYGPEEGVKSLRELSELLLREHGIVASRDILSADLRVLGAQRVAEVGNRASYWWQLPVFNPNLEDARAQLDPAVVEREVSFKIASHVVDILPVGRFIYFMCEAHAGPLVAYWLQLLSWPEILVVIQNPDSCVMHCLSPAAAAVTAERLIGFRVDDGDKEAGDGVDEDEGEYGDGDGFAL